jgi:uncharacterized protein YdaU (DUF1376 family)
MSGSARKPDEWLPLNVRRYLADTTHLARDEHGAYLLLLMAYWLRGGPLPDNDSQLSQIARASPREWRRLRAVLSPFFTISDGRWAQKRAETELAKARGLMEARSIAGQKGARAKWQDRGTGNGKEDGKRIANGKQNDGTIPSTLTPPSEEESSLRSDSCSEPQAASEPAVISIPAIERGSAYRVTQSQEDHWADLYPAVNVPQTLRAILGWCEANPKKRKTLGGMPKFINSWLAREQDRGGLKLNGDGANGHGHRTQTTATDKHLAGLAMLRDEIRNR